ncbi:MAG TPA: zinc finger domain-containing protein [Actinophytocola sp.]|uniref:Fpg/Nei family DNA glycosylase n=1 Tax=Actinophytocola sp. TaxID=1872138 RepID=UPI002F948005
MPEGHTLHRLARRHRKLFAGRPVAVTSPQGRFATAASVVDGRVLRKAEAYGKHLFHVYGPDAIVHVHLGLIGTFSEEPLPVIAPVGAVRMRMVGETHFSDLRGPTVCELVDAARMNDVLARLGPDPLRRNAGPDRAWARLSRSRLPIAALLLDQAVLAGVGNVYRAEILFRHQVDPMVPGRELDPALWTDMWTDLVALMRKGVRSGRIDTVHDEHLPHVTGRAPRRDRHGGEVYVYRRHGQPCLVCGTEVAITELAGRNLYWCPTCQKAQGTYGTR